MPRIDELDREFRAPHRLLIADDDRGFRDTVVEVLEPHFALIAVDSGEAALEVATSVPIAAVLLDMHMHLLTGLETLERFREFELYVPCILMSSLVTADLERAARDLDVVSVLRKPPSRQLLLDTIHCALRL